MADGEDGGEQQRFQAAFTMSTDIQTTIAQIDAAAPTPASWLFSDPTALQAALCCTSGAPTGVDNGTALAESVAGLVKSREGVVALLNAAARLAESWPDVSVDGSPSAVVANIIGEAASAVSRDWTDREFLPVAGHLLGLAMRSVKHLRCAVAPVIAGTDRNGEGFSLLLCAGLVGAAHRVVSARVRDAGKRSGSDG